MKGSPSGVDTLPHDRSGLLCKDGDYLRPTSLFLESIDKWTGAMLFDDKARGTDVGKDVEGLVLSKTSGMVSGIPVVERLVGIHFPYCFDEDQQVAKAYQAACTPDFYLFDQGHRCVYRGRFDGSTPGNETSVTGGDLQHAMDCLLAQEENSFDQLPSMGCNIKWK